MQIRIKDRVYAALNDVFAELKIEKAERYSGDTTIDLSSLNRLPKDGMHRDSVEVFDTLSQTRYVVRRADCGSNCFCAAEIVEGAA